MKCVRRSTLLEYRYDSGTSLQAHEQQMREDGWIVSSKKQYIWSRNAELYREYRKSQREGSFF